MNILKRLFGNKKKRSLPKLDIPSNDNGKCLICDDLKDNRFILSKYLERCNVLYDEVSNGQEALNSVTANGTYRIIFMDIKMPIMDGIDATKALRTNSYSGTIIALTGYVDQKSVGEMMDCGMDSVMRKPIDRGELIMYLEKHGLSR